MFFWEKPGVYREKLQNYLKIAVCQLPKNRQLIRLHITPTIRLDRSFKMNLTLKERENFMQLSHKIAATSIAILTGLTQLTPVTAYTFGQKEVNQSKMIALAVPLRASGLNNLVILEQVSNKRPCWRESGKTPVTVDPLLLKFNFTGICGRVTDSNGYSIRIAGTDLGMQYTISLQKSGGELLLVGTNRRNFRSAPIIIGRTRGLSNGITKIFLQSGWRFTKRTYGGKTLGHVYLTNDSQAFLNN